MKADSASPDDPQLKPSPHFGKDELHPLQRRFSDALGRAAYNFLLIEWGVIWLTEHLWPGTVVNSRFCTSRQLAERLEEAAQYARGDAKRARIVSFANKLGQLTFQRDSVFHAHPRVSLDDDGMASDGLRAGRKVWTPEEVEALAVAFEEAAAEVHVLLHEMGIRDTPAQQVNGPQGFLDAVGLGRVTSSISNDQQQLAAVVNSTLEHLEANPGAVRMPVNEIDLFTVKQFLSREECIRLIAMIDKERRPSTLLAKDPDPTYRTSETCDLPPEDAFVQEVESRIAALLGIDPQYGETMQGQRYAVGQEFKPHHDFFHTDQYYWEEMERMGGQRTWTAMICLGEPEAGGGTNFPSAGVQIMPRQGNLIAWSNLDRAGSPNPLTLHQGMPVERGTKYIITKWYRGRRWERIKPPAT